MIEPTEHDIGRPVIYREAGRHAGRKVETGILTSFTKRYAFVLYDGCTSLATEFRDLEWQGPPVKAIVPTLAAEYAEIEATASSLLSLPKDMRTMMRDSFYAGAACTLYAILASPPLVENGRITVDAKALQARHQELAAFLDDDDDNNNKLQCHVASERELGHRR
jgi:hypothetical protein